MSGTFPGRHQIRKNRKSLAFLLEELSNKSKICWKIWCGREDSNLHGIATASPSSWCVCQFRHYRTGVTSPF
jgi:hypothetical protein